MTEIHFWPISHNWNLIIDLDTHLIYKCARQILQCFELFGPDLSRTLAKMHVEVSLLRIFSQLKFDHIFGCPFDRQACTPTFMIFQDIFTPFNPNLCETTWQSFTFYRFLGIKIWSYLLMCISDDKCARQLSWYLALFSAPLSQTLAKPHNGVSFLITTQNW